MLQYSSFQPVYVMPTECPQDVGEALNVISISQSLSDNSSQNLTSLTSKSNSSGKGLNKDIYVCTFCQVFSPLLTDVAEHIGASHIQCIPPGRSPEDFISKLQALNKSIVKEKGRVGRPRKGQERRVEPQEQKQPVEDPVPGPGGLFWCKKCLHSFRKPRQLTQHICLESNELDSCSDDSFIESEGDEFKIHTDVDPVPWSRRKKHCTSKENLSNGTVDHLLQTTEFSSSIKKHEHESVPNWRVDPSYVPMFCNEEEKAAFEEHVRSIDYSFVDGLFQREEKRCRSNNRKNCLYVQSIVYRCNFCKKVLKSLAQIRLHCLIHTDLKPFTCPKCEYSSNSKGSLYIHMRKHTGNVFCCSYCDFKSVKRAHLLDHEATHSTIPQFCKLCKNAYKTLRSLIAHIKKYHNYPGGLKYIKSLTSKQAEKFKCDICMKKFKSSEILDNHNRVCHKSDTAYNVAEASLEEVEQSLKEVVSSVQMQDPSNLEQQPSEEASCNIQSKDSLAEIVLNDFLQQEQSESIMYENEFSQLCENMLPSSFLPKVVLKDFSTKAISSLPSSSSIVEDCQKTLDLNLLNQCLQDADFSSQQDFGLHSNMANEQSLQNISENSSDYYSHLPSRFLPKVVLKDFFTKAISSLPSSSSIVDDCQKTLDLNLLNQCLQNASFSSQQDFNLHSNIANDQSLQNIPENSFDYGSHLPSSFLPKVVLKDFSTKAISSLPPSSSIVEDCQKALDLNLLNQCLQNADFSNQQNFSLHSNMANEPSLQNISENNSDNGSHLQGMSENKCEEPVEVKLFEKCRRAPAYVCCVCSAIYICPSTLKAHLKEHVNNTNDTLIEQPDEQFEATRMSNLPSGSTETNSDLDNVCEMLQDSSESCSFDKELEKLYTSSLDMMWYLPEVSVVLQSEPALLDPILDDISNFPMSDKYDASQDLVAKGGEDRSFELL